MSPKTPPRVTTPESVKAPIPLLSIRGLGIRIGDGPGAKQLLEGVDLTVGRGEIVGLVGDSGCGKTLTGLAVLGLLPPGIQATAGSIELEGHGDLFQLPSESLRRVRGRQVGMVFQDASTALNPLLTVGFQISEGLRVHRGLRGGEARRRGIELLRRVAIPDPESRWNAYPHELSGGQQQRAMIAMALAPEPRLLLADEPTTALDVTVQAQVLDLLADLRRELGLSVLLVTHNLAVVANVCDRVSVMADGGIAEAAPTREIFRRPRHPETRRLLAAALAESSSTPAVAVP
ncbi:MAG: ABC transporter ATP-binding protein [Acidobacteriota bacterium]